VRVSWKVAVEWASKLHSEKAIERAEEGEYTHQVIGKKHTSCIIGSVSFELTL